MPTIRKVTRGTETIHNYGSVAGGETIDVDGDAAEYLTSTPDYERVATDDESDAESDAVEDTAADTTDTDADADAADADLSELTYTELRDLASEHDISGRSDMDKAELVDALAEATE